MNAETPIQDHEPVGQLSLWIGMLGGATGWALHLLFAYALVPLVCAEGLEILFYVVIAGTIGLAALSVILAYRGWSRSDGDRDHGDRDSFLILNRVRFMSLAGMVTSGFFLVVIIVQSVPIVAYSACEPGGSVRI